VISYIWRGILRNSRFLASRVARVSLRLFAAISLPDDVVERLLALQKGVPGARWRPRENLHLTLRFFGEISEPVADELDIALDEVASRTPRFDLQLKSAGWFGGADPHALWIGVNDSAPLMRLAADCERAARRVGLKPEARKFAPHVTLAYIAGTDLGRVQAFEARLGLFESRPFEVESIALFSSWIRKSAPSQYRLEADYPLAG
jgi:2'-5' RNA ligase